MILMPWANCPSPFPWWWRRIVFAGLLNKNPTVTRIVDWMFAGVFSAFALKIITAQAK
ncbi:hypothetical protein VXQ18_02180 [Brucella abortus]|nr:hypothetical protein [Brucella abortus]